MNRIEAIKALQEAYSLVDEVLNHYEENDEHYFMTIEIARSAIDECVFDLHLLEMKKCTECACLISEHKETGHNLPGIFSRARCACKKCFDVL